MWLGVLIAYLFAALGVFGLISYVGTYGLNATCLIYLFFIAFTGGVGTLIMQVGKTGQLPFDIGDLFGNKDNKKHRANRFEKTMCMIGVLVVLSGVALAAKIRMDMMDRVPVDAVVTSYEKSYDRIAGRTRTKIWVKVQFEYNGETYEARLINANSTMREGRRLTVYVNPANPYDVKIGSYLVCIILCVIGVFVAGVTGKVVFDGYKEEWKIKKLIRRGKTIYGVIDDFSVDITLSVNGVHPYLVHGSYMDETTGTKYTFQSERLWSDPKISLQIGDLVKLYVNENNYGDNYADIDDAIRQAEMRRALGTNQGINQGINQGMNFWE